ncbi:hypothetical protein N4848_05950 [Enterococcus faecalis]|nr:hypothetical protein [Enterococcus faecalis]MCU9760223.1 hypothetical protein [Enterococcus faecalis]MCV6044147.1 hypothetical protein [Enterococcus faecalis]RBR63595.1 hypothetical protein EB38_02273 [Enterococcus faecalis]
MYNRERYFPTLQDYRTYAEKLFSETSNVKNILIEGMHYTRFLLYLTVLYEEIFQEDCDLSKNYRAWYANLLRWHFCGWRYTKSATEKEKASQRIRGSLLIKWLLQEDPNKTKKLIMVGVSILFTVLFVYTTGNGAA